MGERLLSGAQSPKRKTTLKLPAESLAGGLEAPAASKRVDQVLRAYEQAFSGFSQEELMVLDGIMLEPLPTKQTTPLRRPA